MTTLYPLKKYKVSTENLKQSETKLNKTKDLIGTLNKNQYKEWIKFHTVRQALKKFVVAVPNKKDTVIPSNAWAKAIEIYSKYKDYLFRSSHFSYFDNASLPGMFVIAMHSILNTNIKWYASSLTTKNIHAFDDTYELVKYNKNKWLPYIDNHEGDLMDINTIIKIISNRFGKVDIYTSDLGQDASNNYYKQEEQHLIPHVGQILCGLLLMNNSGCMIIKQYTYYDIRSKQLISMLKNFFKDVQIFKPYCSPMTNSENYIICLNYNGNVSPVYKENEEYKTNNEYINELFSVIKDKKLPKSFSWTYDKDLDKSIVFFSDLQIAKICDNIKTIKKCKTIDHNESLMISNNNISSYLNDLKKIFI